LEKQRRLALRLSDRLPLEDDAQYAQRRDRGRSQANWSSGANAFRVIPRRMGNGQTFYEFPALMRRLPAELQEIIGGFVNINAKQEAWLAWRAALAQRYVRERLRNHHKRDDLAQFDYSHAFDQLQTEVGNKRPLAENATSSQPKKPDLTAANQSK
jgi:hypothetical protein